MRQSPGASAGPRDSLPCSKKQKKAHPTRRSSKLQKPSARIWIPWLAAVCRSTRASASAHKHNARKSGCCATPAFEIWVVRSLPLPFPLPLPPFPPCTEHTGRWLCRTKKSTSEMNVYADTSTHSQDLSCCRMPSGLLSPERPKALRPDAECVP